MPTLQLTVHGMTCSNCSARLARILNAADGVISSEIVLETGQVRVDYENIAPDALKTAITDAGFSVA